MVEVLHRSRGFKPVDGLRMPASSRANDTDIYLAKFLNRCIDQPPASVRLKDISLYGNCLSCVTLDMIDDCPSAYLARAIVYNDLSPLARQGHCNAAAHATPRSSANNGYFAFAVHACSISLFNLHQEASSWSPSRYSGSNPISWRAFSKLTRQAAPGKGLLRSFTSGKKSWASVSDSMPVKFWVSVT